MSGRRVAATWGGPRKIVFSPRENHDRPKAAMESLLRVWAGHVTIHSAYHRGQIASDVRSAGQEPAYTDYIHAVRQRFLE